MMRTRLLTAITTCALAAASLAGAAPQQETSALAAAACAAPEGKPLPAPQGLILCAGTARVDVRAADKPQEGVRIAAVAPESPAQAAGFKSGDTIYRIGGEWVSTGPDAVKRLQALRPGQETVVNFWRDGLPFLIRVRG